MDKDQVAAHFRDKADIWVRTSHEGDLNHYPTADHRKRVVRRLLAKSSSSSQVLDLGCGAGHLAIALAEDGHNVTGIDQSTRMIELAREGLANASETVRNSLRFHEGDIEDLDIPANAFDFVTAMGVIGYFPDDHALFALARKALKKEGRFIVSTRNRLFNMVSHSHRTTREITNGGAATLVEELASFREPVSVDRTKSFVKALSDIARELEASDVLDRAVERNDKDTSSTRMGNEARQHTPRELEASADANGFTIESLHGIHPHLLNPALNNLLPSGVFNALSSALEPLEDEAISLTWSSVFIAVMRQK